MFVDRVAPHRIALLALLALVPVAAYGLDGAAGAAATAALAVLLVAGMLLLAFGLLEDAGTHGSDGSTST